MINLPRSTPKWVWKRVYRQYRICRRELHAANTDAQLYGSGMLRIHRDGIFERIRPSKIRIDSELRGVRVYRWMALPNPAWAI